MADEKPTEEPGLRLSAGANGQASVADSSEFALVEKNQHSGITRIPGVCGGHPCIKGTRMAVWILYQAKSKGVADDQLLKRHPFLKRADLENAWMYVKDHQSEIDEAVRDNNAW
jgi:uncharacterized protein (DUF433 family)